MKRLWAMRTAGWAAVVASGLVAMRASAAEAPAAKSDQNKMSYALGVEVARNLRRQGTEVDMDSIIRGLKDGLSNERLMIPETEVRDLLTTFQTDMRRKQAQFRGRTAPEVNKKRGEMFLEENKTKPGVVSLPSGLQYQILKAGNGPKPAATDTVKCHYRGTRLDGSEFICSDPDKPLTVKVKEADTPGWREALQLMPIGSKWRFFFPAQLAYGARGVGKDIGPNEAMVLDLELLAIQ